MSTAKPKFTKWKVSDILIVACEHPIIIRVIQRALAEEDLADVLRCYDVTFSRVCGIDEDVWADMSHEQRCGALVARARKLNVPMRAK